MARIIADAVVVKEPENSLLIVVPKNLESPLGPFVEAKRAELGVSVGTLEQILAENKGLDDAEKLKRFLYQRWHEHGVRYVLLVGDADVLPVRRS